MRAKDVLLYAFIVSRYALYTAGYIVLDIWLWDLFHDFGDRHQPRDANYSIAGFSFFLIWAFYYCLCFLATLVPQLSTPSPGRKLQVFVFFARMIVRAVFIHRFSLWLSHFMVLKETENVAYCAACLFAMAWGLSEQIVLDLSHVQWLVVQGREIREKWSKEGNIRDVERMNMRISRTQERVESFESEGMAGRAERTESLELVGRAERIERDVEGQ